MIKTPFSPFMTTPNPQGHRRASTTATVCENLATRKYDRFHDEHWSFRRQLRAAARVSKAKRLALALAAFD